MAWSSGLIALALAGLSVVAYPSSDAYRLRVERSLPVVGVGMSLSVRPTGGECIPESASVRFTVRSEVDGNIWQASATPERSQVCVRWAPTVPGPHLISAEVDGVVLPAVSVFAASRPLHFSYWSCPPDQRYVTSVMHNGPDDAAARQWLDRGVLPLVWKPGALGEYRQPEQWARDYTSLPPGRVGVMIDEFYGAGEPPHLDDLAAQGLALARRAAPDLFIAPYCLTVEREAVREGFALANVLLVELYRRDWRGYDFARAFSRFTAAGLGDKAIPVLAAGPGNAIWITTEQELRSQVAFIRTIAPELPGIGFFPELYPGLAESIDRAIYDYYLGPVILVQDGLIRNIGQLPARDVRVVDNQGEERGIAVIHPGGHVAMAQVQAALPADRYVVVSHTPPTELGPPATNAATQARLFEQQVLGGRAPLALRRNELSLLYLDPEEPNANRRLMGAEITLWPSGHGAVGLCFELQVTEASPYGQVEVALRGKGALSVAFSHSDGDADLPGSQPRAAFVVWSDARVPVAATCPVGLVPGTSYRVFIGHDGAQTALMSLQDAHGAMLWTSGPLKLAGPVTVDKLAFAVNPFEGSSVCVAGESVRLRGVAHGPAPSPYVLEATVWGVITAGAEGLRDS